MPYLEARRNAVVRHGGDRVRIRKGDVAEAEASIVEGRERLWKPLKVRFLANRKIRQEMPVEQATAAPGEKRELQFETRAVREWAAANGYDVSPRGKLPADVVEAYQAAHPGE